MAKKAYVYDGTAWQDLSNSVADLSQYANLNTTPISGFRNKIINGDFDIWQRGTSATVTPGSTVYFADRWACYAAGATVYPYRNPGITGTSSQYAAYVNSAAGNMGVTFLQRIESSNVKLANGSSFTVSAKISSPNSRSINIYVQSANATDNFSAKTVVGSSTVSLSAGVNTIKITFTANAACANGIELGFEFGSLISGTIGLGQVQLEAGSTATPFEQRPYGTELALCQRYYVSMVCKMQGLLLADSRFVRAFGSYPVQMRINPTYVSNSLSNASINSRNGTYTALYDVSSTTTINYELGLYVSGLPGLGNAWEGCRIDQTSSWNAEL